MTMIAKGNKMLINKNSTYLDLSESHIYSTHDKDSWSNTPKFNLPSPGPSDLQRSIERSQKVTAAARQLEREQEYERYVAALSGLFRGGYFGPDAQKLARTMAKYPPYQRFPIASPHARACSRAGVDHININPDYDIPVSIKLNFGMR